MANTIESVREILRSPERIRAYLPRSIVASSVMAEGGQGVVYSGSVKGAAAAIKVYFPGQTVKRIEREIESLQQIDCRSIVDLLAADVITVENCQLSLVATALIPGQPLNQILAGDPLLHDKIGVLAYDVAEAIDKMWARRIVHRDLKPSNIIITDEGRACVIDLGLARHIGRSDLTTIGVTWGTLGYLSPEQNRCVRQLSCKSDLFTMGVVLVEAALGRHPTQRDQLRLFARRLHESLPQEIANWEHAPLLQELLHPRPTKRPKPVDVMVALETHKP